MRSVWLLPLVLGGCIFWPKTTLEYRNDTLEVAVQSWADAFNRDRPEQLRLLVHPDKREAFAPKDPAIRAELASLLVQRYALGHVLKVNEQIEGREVTLYLHDGAGVEPRRTVWVRTEGRWWLWRY